MWTWRLENFVSGKCGTSMLREAVAGRLTLSPLLSKYSPHIHIISFSFKLDNLYILMSSYPNTAPIFISSCSLSNLSILIEPPPAQVRYLIVLKILHTIHAMAIHWFKEKLHHACVLESLRSSADRCARCRMIALRVVNLQWMWWVTRVYPEVKNLIGEFDIIVFWKNHLLLIFQHGS